MSRHYHLRAGVYTSLERNKLILLYFFIALVYTGKSCVAVGIGIAVTWEMLECGNNALLVQRFNKSCALSSNDLRIIRKRPDSDDRIRGIVVYINNRSKIRIYPYSFQLVGYDRCIFFRQLNVICSAESHIARGNTALSQTGNISALMVCRYDKLRTAAAL